MFSVEEIQADSELHRVFGILLKTGHCDFKASHSVLSFCLFVRTWESFLLAECFKSLFSCFLSLF